MNKPTLKEQAHGEIEKIFRILLPQNGLAVREEQITLCHAMLDTLPPLHIARKIEDVEDFIRTKKSPDYFMP